MALAWPLVVLTLGLVAAWLVHRWAGTTRRIGEFSDQRKDDNEQITKEFGRTSARLQKLEDDLLNLSQRVSPSR